MVLYPAIDLVRGKAVRLYKGDYAQMTVYSEEPVSVAKAFQAAGARNIHLVDLEGAKSGVPENLDTIRKILAETHLFVEVGGGIRTEERIQQYMDSGVGRCILGTIAVKDFDFTTRMAQKYGDKIAVGVDARDGYVAINGWKELSSETGIEFCQRLANVGVKTVIYTDISRDGAEKGTNLELYRELAKIKDLNITASGGVSSLEELRELQALGTHAAILGKALYTGRLDLKMVIEGVGAC